MTKELKMLRNQLRGHYEKIANKTGKSISTVSLVLNGKYVNEDVIKAAVEVRNDVLKEKERQQQRISKHLKK